MSDSLQPHDLYSPWNCPDQNTGVGSLSVLQGIFPTQESYLGLLYCRQILYQLSYQGSPPFTLAPLKRKHLVRNLIKYVEGLFEGNYKTLMREIKELNKWRHFSWKPVLYVIKKTKHDLSIEHHSNQNPATYYVQSTNLF